MADIRTAWVFRAMAWAIAIVPALVYAGLLATGYTFSGVAVDWQSYVVGTDRLLAGQSPFSAWQLAGPYSFDAVAGGNGFIYPPSAAIIMAPFLKPFGLWVLVNVSLYVAGIVAVLRRDGHSAPVTGLMLWAALIPGWLVDGLIAGAVSCGLAGILGLIYAGAPLSGIAGGLKGFPIIWFAVEARERIRRSALALLVTLGVPIAISLLLAGVGPWVDFVRAFMNAQPACDLAPFSLVCAGAPRTLMLALGICLGLATFRLPRQAALLAAGFALIVAAPEVWDHYWTTIVPGSVACGAWALRSSGRAAMQRRSLPALSERLGS